MSTWWFDIFNEGLYVVIKKDWRRKSLRFYKLSKQLFPSKSWNVTKDWEIKRGLIWFKVGETKIRDQEKLWSYLWESSIIAKHEAFYRAPPVLICESLSFETSSNNEPKPTSNHFHELVTWHSFLETILFRELDKTLLSVHQLIRSFH